MMATRKNIDDLKKKSAEVQSKIIEAQDKYKQSERELEEFRTSVHSAVAQKASLLSLSKVCSSQK